MHAATAIALLLAIHAATGSLFALYFITKGVQQFDPAARNAGFAFRLMIFPGVATMWPLFVTLLLTRPKP